MNVKPANEENQILWIEAHNGGAKTPRIRLPAAGEQEDPAKAEWAMYRPD